MRIPRREELIPEPAASWWPPPALVLDQGDGPPVEPGSPSLTDQQRRALAALLRGRAHALPARMGPRLAAAARLLPVLLHVSFDERGLDGEAPGVAGLRYRRRWHQLTRAFALPPPCRAQRGRCMVEAVLALPSALGLEITAVIAPDATDEARRRLEERLVAAGRVLARTGARVALSARDSARLARDEGLCDRLFTYGALLAGSPTEATWEALACARRPLTALATATLAAQAPTPLASLALTLLTGRPCPSPLDASLRLFEQGVPARALVDPERFCVRWAGLEQGAAAFLARTEELVARPELVSLVNHGRALALACGRAIHASRLGSADRQAQRLWRESVGPGLPRVLLPALGTLLAAEAAAGRLSFLPVRDGRSFEVRSGPALLGRGGTPAQARVRALDLVSRALSARPDPGLDGLSALPAGLDQAWRELAHRLVRASAGATRLLVVVVPRAPRPGVPLDPLNRGPTRRLEVEGALAVSLAPWRRPSARVLDGAECVAAAVAHDDGALEVVPSSAAARLAATRLAQVAALVRDPTVLGPVAVEAGGRVLLCGAGGTRAYALGAFTARPRHFTPDPGAPDLGVGGAQRAGARARPTGLVACRVIAGPTHAAILYATDAGEHLRELAPLGELEERLADALRIVRAASPRAALAVHLTDAPEQAMRRAGVNARRVGITVGGALPFPWVEIEGERFGGLAGLGWRAAAETLMARWPSDGDAVLGVDAVVVTAAGLPASPILSLHAASYARRRLSAHLARALAAYRSAAGNRREG